MPEPVSAVILERLFTLTSPTIEAFCDAAAPFRMPARMPAAALVGDHSPRAPELIDALPESITAALTIAIELPVPDVPDHCSCASIPALAELIEGPKLVVTFIAPKVVAA